MFPNETTTANCGGSNKDRKNHQENFRIEIVLLNFQNIDNDTYGRSGIERSNVP